MQSSEENSRMSSSTTSKPTSIYQDCKQQVNDAITTYSSKYADIQESDPAIDKSEVAKERKETAETTTEIFYNLVTDFYEYGWGESFHFAPIYDDKTLQECIAEYEKEAGKMVGAKPGITVLVSQMCQSQSNYNKMMYFLHCNVAFKMSDHEKWNCVSHTA